MLAYNFPIAQLALKMQIQLKQFHNGRPVLAKENSQHIEETIEKLKEAKKYNQILDIVDRMEEGKQKYLVAVDAYLGLRNWHKLAQFCEKGLKHGEESQFYHLKGKALGKMGNRDKQIELINKAISLNPYVPAYHRNLGAGYYSLKEYLKAIESHLKAVEIEPANGVNYHNLGSAYFRLKEYRKAIEYFEEGIKRNPSQALSFSWKGDCLREEGHLLQAKECYDIAYQLTHSAVYLKEKEKMEDLIHNQEEKK